jgi:hypothetical protein
MPSRRQDGPPAPAGGRSDDAEKRVAFYKMLKFWLVFLLAVCLAAALWRALRPGGQDGASAPVVGVSYIR